MQSLRSPATNLALSLLLGTLLGACGAPTSGDPQTDTDASVDDADAGAAKRGVLSGHVFDGASGLALQGATVCIQGADNCVDTDAAGSFELSAPQGSVVAVASLQNYEPSALSFTLSDSTVVDLPLISEMLFSEQQIRLGVTGDAGLLASFYGQNSLGEPAPLAGASLQLQGNEYAGAGALYDVSGTPRTTGATSADGLALVVDLMAGDYTALANHPEGACVPTMGTQGDSLTVATLPDHINLVGVSCLVDVADNVSAQGTLVAYDTGLAVTGAGVCLSVDEGAETCATTDGSGAYQLSDIAPHADAVLRVNADGYHPTRIALNTGPGLLVDQVLTSTGAPRTELPSTPDPETMGSLVITAYDIATVIEGDYPSASTQDGVSFSIFPEVGLGPYYQLEPGYYSSEVAATYGSGQALVYGLPEGTYTARFDHPWGPCTPGHGRAYNADSRTFTFKVEAGVETHLVGACQVVPPDAVNIIGSVTNGADTKVPIAGAEVCASEFAAADGGEGEVEVCTTTDEFGSYELRGVPSNTLMWLATSSSDYRSGRTLVNTQNGLTYDPELSSLVIEDLFFQPLVDLGVCEDVEDLASLDDKYAFFGTRAYDAAYNSDSFFQGVTLDRVRMQMTNVTTGDVHGSSDPWKYKMVFGPQGFPSPELTETTPNGLTVWCNLEVGEEYHIVYTHPFGTCQVSQGLPPDPEDGGYTFRVYSGESFGFVAACDVTPPAGFHEEMAADPDLATTGAFFESSGIFDFFDLATEAPVYYSGNDRITVLAPRSDALTAFLEGEEDVDDLFQLGLAAHHIIYGELELDQLVRDLPHWSLAGRPIVFIDNPDGTIGIEGTDISVTPEMHWTLDGIVYVLDGVMDLPEMPDSAISAVEASAESAALIGPTQPSHESLVGDTSAAAPSYTVYTPPRYYDTWPQGYPVLYVLHDIGGDDKSLFGGFTMGEQAGSGVHEIVDTLVKTDNIAPMIVVAINGMNAALGSYFVDSKLPDGGDAFGNFQAYLAAVMSEVESTYNVATQPGSPTNRALLGVGMGGFGAVHAAAQNPVFSAVAIHSGLLSLSDLLAPDAMVAAQYPDADIDGSLASEFLEAWTQTLGAESLDGRLVGLVGLEAPEVITRVIAMASAFSPRQTSLYEFDMMATSPFFSGLAPPDEDPSDNRDYPMVLVDAGQDLESDLDDIYLGFQLPFKASGATDPDVWAQWAVFEPIDAISQNAEALIAADTDFYIDCGLQNERGFADQAESFSGTAIELLGADRVTLEFYAGDHDATVYTERLYTSLAWIGATFAEE